MSGKSKQKNRKNKRYQRKLYKKALSHLYKLKDEIVQELKNMEIKVKLYYNGGKLCKK